MVETPEQTPKRAGTILVVEDDPSLRRLTQVQLDRMGFLTRTAADVRGGLEVLRHDHIDLVICDLHLPSASGLDLLKTIRGQQLQTKFVIVTAYGSVHTAIEAMKAGAYDYITKPLHPIELRNLVDRVFDLQASQENHTPQAGGRRPGFEVLIGRSPALASIIDLAVRSARTDAPVLITGETGTGKEVLARAIHFNSPRGKRPFVIVNCGAIPRDLVESELFGHVKGAFTGAVFHKKGKAEMADGGTLFLDEIGEMPLDMQVRLLRLIQQGDIQKVGDSDLVHVDVRVIAATHRNLEQLVHTGGFREDLYYRLLVVPIEIPPLRQRREDIPDLVRHLFKESTAKYHREGLKLPESLMPYFIRYDWPGNVRQLANCIVRMVVLAVGEETGLKDLPDVLRAPSTIVPGPIPLPHVASNTTLEGVERQLILEALEKFNWNQTRAALHLGVSRKILRGRIARYGIRKTDATPYLGHSVS